MLSEMKRVGKIKPVKSSQITFSRIGLGMEKLDRDAFDPNPLYEHVENLGVKWIRIQSGWAKTEKAPGQYNFAWLDKIVDNLLNRGLHPWMCLCYGNGLYTPEAAEYVGAVGFPPLGDVEFTAWAAYITRTVEHFRGRISSYEIWNEPDGTCWRHGANAQEYGEFAKKTAILIKELDNNAKIIVGAVYTRDLKYIDDMLATGLYKYTDALSFHDYTYDERYIIHRIQAMQALLDQYKPGIKIIQGESGSQSRSGGFGALNWVAMNEQMQAKQLIRHAMADLIGEVEFTSYFSCVDMVECVTGGKIGGDDLNNPGYFGLLTNDLTQTDPEKRHVAKPSYYAMQTIAAIFHNCTTTALPILLTPKKSPTIDGEDTTDATIVLSAFKNEQGDIGVVYWNSTDMLKIKEYESTISMQIVSKKKTPHLVDLIDGSVYTFNNGQYSRQDNTYTFINIPITDRPLLLAFDDFINFVQE